MTKMIYLAALAALLAGCSSPPEPLAVAWDNPAQPMNADLPHWEANNAVIPSPVVTGHWSKHVVHFNPDNIFTPAVWYATAHSSQAVVSAPDSESYFTAKTWLRRGGYKGLIAFSPQKGSLSSHNTDIFFYR